MYLDAEPFAAVQIVGLELDVALEVELPAGKLLGILRCSTYISFYSVVETCKTYLV